MELCSGVTHPTSRRHGPPRRQRAEESAANCKDVPSDRLTSLCTVRQRHCCDPRRQSPMGCFHSKPRPADSLAASTNGVSASAQCSLLPMAYVRCRHDSEANIVLVHCAAHDGARQGGQRRRRMKGRIRKSRTAASGTMSPRFGRMSKFAGLMVWMCRPSACICLLTSLLQSSGPQRLDTGHHLAQVPAQGVTTQE